MSSRLREALENSNGLLEELALLGEWGESARAQIAENRAALAEPVRNYEVGTAEEQTERFGRFCDGCDRKWCGPQAKALHLEKCALRWAQMPYEEGENKWEMKGEKK